MHVDVVATPYASELEAAHLNQPLKILEANVAVMAPPQATERAVGRRRFGTLEVTLRERPVGKGAAAE